MDAPLDVNPQDLALELKEYLNSERAHFYFAFFGRAAAPTEVTVDGHGAYRVEPVRCELELRERFAALSDSPRVVWLVPFLGHVPHDLRHRFAKDGSVRTIGALAQMRRLFKVQSVEPGLDNGPLAQWLLQRPVAQPAALAVNAQRLTAPVMWSAWFASETGIEGLSDLSLGQWLLRCAGHGEGPKLLSKLRADPLGERVVQAFTEQLERSLGPIGALSLAAWGEGRGAALLQYAVVSSAILDGGDEAARMWLELKLDSLGVKGPGLLPALRAAGEQALHELSRTDSGRASLLALLRACEDVVDKPAARAALARHEWLPAGYRARLDQLGVQLERALASGSTEALQQAIAAEAALAQHHHYAELGREDADRARMAVRLLCFVLRARSWMRELPAGDLDASQRLAVWYSQEGGYVDLARYQARTGHDSAFGRGVRVVLDEVDSMRRTLDKRFALGLAQWLGAGAPGGRTQTMQSALGTMLKQALAGKPDRRAVVLLMDGMAWADCIALLRSSAESADAFRPLSLNRALSTTSETPEGSPHGLATLASIPTITKVSRSAFFEGKLPSSGIEPSSSDDARRFAGHPTVTELNHGRPARLLLRADGHLATGELSDEARTLLRDTNERIVGLVVNAIDASLKSDPQQVQHWTLGTVRSLGAIFEEARRAGRIILLASDHGHVRSFETEKSALPSDAVAGGERWRGMASHESHGVLRDDQAGAPLAFEGKLIWAPPGARGITVLTDERGRHTRQPHAGEHGGATLAEVVAPCLWLGAFGEPLDPGLATEAVLTPEWWSLTVPSAVPKSAARGSTPSLPGVDLAARAGKGGAPTRSRRPSQPALSRFAVALSESELFRRRPPKAALRDQVLSAVDFLAQRDGGVATLQDLGDAVGEPFYRVAGFISQLQRVLNLDGEAVIERPSETSLVKLNVELLTQLFEVPR